MSRPAYDTTERPGYVAYARMDELLELVQPLTDEPAETAFIVLSQVEELLFHLLAEDCERAAASVRADDLTAARRTLRRVLATLRTLDASWEPLADMEPAEFTRIRAILTGASGLQSVSYRRWEFAMGRRTPSSLNAFGPYPQLRATLAEALSRPSLDDEAVAALARRGYPVPPAVLERDPAVSRDPDGAVTAAWVQMYREAERDDPLRGLAEDLVSVAHAVARWRYSHLLVVERILGPKTGTGGTAGVPWLAAIAEHRFFTELWQARYHL